MAVRIGFKGKAYYGTAGSKPGTELTRIISVTPDESVDKIAANDRGNADRNLNLPGRKNGSVDIEFNWDDEAPGLTGLVALRDAYDSGGLIAIKFLDQAGAIGWWADCHVFNWSRSEPGDGPMTVSVNVEVFTNFTRLLTG